MFRNKPLDIEQNIANVTADDYIKELCGYKNPDEPGKYAEFLNSFDEVTLTNGPYIAIKGSEYIKNASYNRVYIPEQIKGMLQTYLDLENGTISSTEIEALSSDKDFVRKQVDKLNSTLDKLENPDKDNLPLSLTDFRKKLANINSIKSAYKVLVNEGIPNIITVMNDGENSRKIRTNFKLSALASTPELQNLTNHFEKDPNYKRYHNVLKKSFSKVNKFVRDFKDYNIKHTRVAAKGMSLNKQIANLEANLIKKRALYDENKKTIVGAAQTLSDHPTNQQAARILKNKRTTDLKLQHEIIETEHELNDLKHQYKRLLEKNGVNTDIEAPDVKEKKENDFVVHGIDDLMHVIKHAFEKYMNEQRDKQSLIKEDKKKEKELDKVKPTTLSEFDNSAPEVVSPTESKGIDPNMLLMMQMMKEMMNLMKDLSDTIKMQHSLDMQKLDNLRNLLPTEQSVPIAFQPTIESEAPDAQQKFAPAIPTENIEDFPEFFSISNDEEYSFDENHDYHVNNKEISPAEELLNHKLADETISIEEYYNALPPTETSMPKDEVDRLAQAISQNLPDNLQFIRDNLGIHNMVLSYDNKQEEISIDNAKLNFYKNLVETFDKISTANPEKSKGNQSFVPATFNGVIEQYRSLGGDQYIEKTGLMKVVESIEQQCQSSPNRTQLIIDRLNSNEAKDVIAQAKKFIPQYENEVNARTKSGLVDLSNIALAINDFSQELQNRVDKSITINKQAEIKPEKKLTPPKDNFAMKVAM